MVDARAAIDSPDSLAPRQGQRAAGRLPPRAAPRYAGMVAQRDVMVAMRDGVGLCIDVFRAPTQDKLPALLAIAPYNKALLWPEFAEASLLRSYPPALRHTIGHRDGHDVGHSDDAFQQYRGRFLANDPQAFAALTRAFTTINLNDRLGRITCPALIVGCTDDAIKPAAECAQLAGLLTRGRYAQAHSGHFIAVQSPELLADLVNHFLDEIDDTS